MMNLQAYLFLLLFSAPNMSAITKDFHQLSTKRQEAQFLLEHQKSNDPSVLAYVCAIEMKQAEYSYNPYRKIEIFNSTKKKLNDLIRKRPSNVHLRYVRLLLQEKTPSILGYKDKIETDKKFLKRVLSIKDASDYLDYYIYKYTSL
jgi:hypothetical protein